MGDTERTGASPVEQVAEAAVGSAEATSDAIRQAADANEDPAVAEALEEAAVHAETTVGRVGWLRSFIRRLMPGR